MITRKWVNMAREVFCPDRSLWLSIHSSFLVGGTLTTDETGGCVAGSVVLAECDSVASAFCEKVPSAQEP